MKKGFVAFLFAVGVLMSGANAFAVTAPSYGFYGDPNSFYMYTSDSIGGKVKPTFTLDQQPWLYINMPGNGSKAYSASWFNTNSGFSSVHDVDFTSAGGEWLTISNWNNLSKEQKLGLWNVNGSYAMSKTNKDGGELFLNVVAPEPISALLFLLGGAGLGIRRFFVKK
jgi:hypothetical protein